MVVIHLFRNLIRGGCQTLALEICKKTADQIQLYIISVNSDDEMSSEFQKIGAVVYKIPQKRDVIRKIISNIHRNEKSKPVIVSWFFPMSLYLCPLEYRHVGHVGTAHSPRLDRTYLANLAILHLYKNADIHYIFCSDHVEKTFERTYFLKIDRSKKSVEYNGIDLNKFTPSKYIKSGMDRSEFVILFVGRLDGSKDPEMLIRQAPEIKKRIPEAVIKIIGDGKMYDELRAMAKPYPFILLLGLRSDIAEQLQECDAFVFPNKDVEGFGNVIIEAMASCVPTIANRIGASEEIISHGEDGFLINTGYQLPVILEKLKQDKNLTRRIGVKGRDTVYRKFNVIKTALAYKEILLR